MGFLTLTGVPPEEFERHLPAFIAAGAGFEEPGPVEDRPVEDRPVEDRPVEDRPVEDRPIGDRPIEDRLLFIWLHAKARATRVELAAHFDLSAEQTTAWINRLLPVFEQTLAALASTALSSECVRFLQLLNAQQVDYVVIGGQAVAFHGYLRPILDLDLFIATDPGNAQKLTRVLGDFANGIDPRVTEYFQIPERVIRIGQPPLTVEHFAPQGRFLHLGRPPTQVELLTSISAVTFAECRAGRVLGVIEGLEVPFIGLPELRANKRASIRDKDADDLAHLP